MHQRFLMRDAAIILGTVLLWRLLAGASEVTGAAGDFAGVFSGFLLGACALLTHEWGHFQGAALSRAAQRLRQVPGALRRRRAAPGPGAADARPEPTRRVLERHRGR